MTTLAGRRVLVTGATGFIGSHLCCELNRAGAQVHAVSRRDGDGSAHDGIRWWRGDLAYSASARRVMRATEPEFVFHLASHVTGSRGLPEVTRTLRNNLLTTVNVLTAACETGRPRVLLAGSVEESGSGGPEAAPVSPYAAAKSASAAYGRMFHALYGLPVANLRIAMAYGPGQDDHTKVIPYTIGCLLRGQRPRLSSGRRDVDWIYIDDVVRAIVAVAVADDIGGQIIDIGSGETATVREVVLQLARLVGGEAEPLFGALPDRALEERHVADLRLTRALTAWEPAVALPVGLARTVEWFRAQ